MSLLLTMSHPQSCSLQAYHPLQPVAISHSFLRLLISRQQALCPWPSQEDLMNPTPNLSRPSNLHHDSLT